MCVCVQVDEESFWTLGDKDLSEMGITNAQDRSKIVSLISSRGNSSGKVWPMGGVPAQLRWVRGIL